ncbi:MAG: type 1 glutamine amidotransferase domain-containing protein [Bdellovibrionia bacterium]
MFLILLFSLLTEVQVQAKTILVPLPSYGFDPTETGVPYQYLKNAGHKITFATPEGGIAKADLRMLTGQDLGIFKNVLMNDKNGTAAYLEMEGSEEFQNPISYGAIDPENFDALLLPGGHDKGMRPYLESKILQNFTVAFFDSGKPVAAICHGTLLAARSISPKNGRSVLWGRKTTGLTRRQEMTAYMMTRTYLGDYYRTYETPMADEVRSFLKDPADFDTGPGFPIPSRRDSPANLKPGFTVRDGRYLSARWPGDAHRFSAEFVKLLAE